MGCYKRLKLVLDNYRKADSKFVFKTPTKSNCSYSCSWFYKGFIRHFCIWFQNPKDLFSVVLVFCGAVISFFFGSIGVLPYTNRKHFMIVFKTLDRLFASHFKYLLKVVEWKILPDEHPDCVRVRLVGNDIIAALQLWLRNEQDSWLGGLDWEILVIYTPMVASAAYLAGGKIFVSTGFLKEIQTDAEIATFICHEVGHAVALHFHVKVWDALWRILVGIALYLIFMPYTVKSTIQMIGIHAIYTKLRRSPQGPQSPKKEFEANYLGLMLKVWDTLWRIIIPIALYLFFLPHTVKTTIEIVGAYAMYSLLLRLPLKRKMELEADYIGLMLMASAGYDPRVVPNFLKKLGEVGSILSDIIATHPSVKKRVKFLSEALEEALIIYRQTSRA